MSEDKERAGSGFGDGETQKEQVRPASATSPARRWSLALQPFRSVNPNALRTAARTSAFAGALPLCGSGQSPPCPRSHEPPRLRAFQRHGVLCDVDAPLVRVSGIVPLELQRGSVAKGLGSYAFGAAAPCLEGRTSTRGALDARGAISATSRAERKMRGKGVNVRPESES